MIRFSDSESALEIIYPDISADNFKDIKAVGSITESDSQHFWENFFNNLERLNDIDEEMFAEVYGRSEDEFTFVMFCIASSNIDFDFDVNDSDISEQIELFSPEKWLVLKEAEKKRLLLILLKL